MTTEILLPPNATPQERALEVAMRPGSDVVAGVELIRTAKENPPDDWLYWLIWEYGLEELLPYLADPRVVLEQGIQWQRLRGTPASVALALSWIGITPDIDEEDPLSQHWFEFQIDPGRIPTQAELRNLVGLARLSAPVGTRLSRLFHGYDMRRAIWDFTSWSDGSLWSDHSGVYDPDLGVVVSFGQTLQSSSSLGDVAIHIEYTQIASTSTQYNDVSLWDFGRWDDEAPTLNYPFQALDVLLLLGQGVGRNLLVADGTITADGSYPASGGPRPELPQLPAAVFTGDISDDGDGWGSSVGWGDRTWGDTV